MDVRTFFEIAVPDHLRASGRRLPTPFATLTDTLPTLSPTLFATLNDTLTDTLGCSVTILFPKGD